MADIRVGQAESGRAVVVDPGDVVVLDLEENLTTGYSWSLEGFDASILRSGGSTTVEPATAEPAGEVLGAPGRRLITLTAIRPGRTIVRAHLARPWESGRPPARSFSMTVTVRPPQPR